MDPGEDVDELAKSPVEKTAKTPRGRKSTARAKPEPQFDPEPKTPKKARSKKSVVPVEKLRVPAEDEDARGESDHEMGSEKVTTRAQQREAEIEKRDRMAQEIMDAMEF